jgi:hypothetical protein
MNAKNKILNLVRGFLADFWMLPIAIIIAFWHEEVTAKLNLFPPLNPEKIGNIIPAFVVFLLAMFLVRLYFFAQYPSVYRKSLMRRSNGKWRKLNSSQQFLYLRVERWVLLIVFAIIFAAMM